MKTVNRLFQQVVAKKKSTLYNLDSSAQEPPELKLLWERSVASSSVVSHASCDALVHLVIDGHAEFNYILNRLLNLAPSAKNLSGIIRAVTDLLLLQVAALLEKEDMSATLMYGIRNAPHPFITIATNRPDSWLLLQQQVQRLLGLQDARLQPHMLPLLGPFLKYILLDPQQSTQSSPLCVTLTRTLVQGSRSPTIGTGIVQFLIDCLAALQVKSSSHLGAALGFIEEISRCRIYEEPQSDSMGCDLSGEVKWSHAVGSALVTNLLALSPDLVATGQDVSSSLTLVLDLAKQFPRVLSTELNILQVTSILSQVPHCHLPTVLRIAKIALDTKCDLNPYIVGSLVLPCLQVISSPSPVALGADKKGVSGAATQVMRLIEDLLDEWRENHQTSEKLPVKKEEAFHLLISPKATTLTVYKELVDSFIREPQALHDWLDNVLRTLENHCGTVPYHVTCLVAAALVISDEREILWQLLQLLVTIAKCDPSQGPSFLPLLMYRLNRETSSITRLEFLNTIPRLATHKVTVTPILKTLQAFSGFDQLQPFSIRLICSLWQQEDRCFVHLQKLLLSQDPSPASKSGNISEWLVAKAACIRDICQERPHQHGADMLSLLSAILNDCTSENEAVPSYLALQALYALCEAEVVDVRTAWAVLAAKLAKDSRSQVVCGICELFSLVPSLAVETPEYESFMADCVSTLWTHSRSVTASVAQAAYRALVEYPQTSFTLDHLPDQVTQDVREAAALKMAEDLEDGDDTPAPPGFCFLRLMTCVTQEVLPAYEEFLTGLLSEEVANLPRGIYHASLRKHAAPTNPNRALADIPQFLQLQHEKVRHPGIQPSLAVGVLLSYSPPLELGRDGKPRKSNIITYGRMYHQMLYALLNEVPVEPADWHRSLVLPQAWTNFMDRCFQAYLESREAELELQMFHGQVNDPDEHKLKALTAWMWTRDKLTDLIKSASRGNPSVQGNCVCALVGLSVTVAKYANGLDEEHITASEQMTEHLSMPHWLNIAVSTLLCIFNPDHVPSGRIFTMCQQRGAHDRTTAALLARGCACVAMSQMVPVLITTTSDTIPRILAAMVAWLPGQPQAPPQLQLQFYVGLGLGMFLAALVEEDYEDAGSSLKGCVGLWQAVKCLEDCSFSAAKHRLGSVLGLGVCVGSLACDGNVNSRTYVSSVQEQLTVAMEMTDTSDELYEVICLSVALSASAAYSYNILSVDVLDRIVAHIVQQHHQDTGSVGVSLSLAMLCYSLLHAGHPTVAELVTQLYSSWMSNLTRQTSSDQERLAALNGLLALCGSEKFMLKFPEDMGTSPPVTGINLSEVVKMSCDLTAVRGDLSLQSSSAVLLGLLHYSSSAAAEAKSSVPSSYQYLSETSILQGAVDLLIQAGKQGSDAVSMEQVTTVLRCMVEGPSRPLPPLGWAGLLSPLLRRNYGSEVERLSLKLALNQSVAAPSATLFVSSWLLPPLFDTLQDTSKLLLYKSLPLLIKSVPAPKLQEFLEGNCSAAIQGAAVYQASASDQTTCSPDSAAHSTGLETVDVVVLKGLAGALKVHDPPQSVTLLLYQTLEQTYASIPAAENYAVYHALCECLTEVPDEVVDKVVQISRDASAPELLRDLYIRCFLVARGSQPLTWVNPVVEEVMYRHHDIRTRNSALLLLLKCFYSVTQDAAGKPKPGPGACQQWLLELMGHIKNMATGTIELPDEMPAKEVLEVALLVFGAAVVVWSEVKVHIIQGLIAFSANIPSNFQPNMHLSTSELVHNLMPHAVESLSQVSSWKQMNGKFIDWFISLHSAPSTSGMPKVRNLIKSCVYSLRHTAEFSKVATWSAAYMMD